MKKRLFKVLSILVIFNLLYQIGFPIAAYGLTGGPSQPEVHGFEPVGTNQMVDLFSGDFTYNIPLMDVGGYPINMAYHSGINMDQEASWVGLGWSLTPGSINRAMRGLPDDFMGEEITKERNMKANQTVGVDVSVPIEFLGIDVTKIGKNFNPSVGLYNNSYRGIGVKAGISGGGNFGPTNITGSIGFDSQNGSDLNLGLSFSKTVESSSQEVTNGEATTGKMQQAALSAGINIGMGSSRGMQSLSFSGSAKAGSGSYTKHTDNNKTTYSPTKGFGVSSSMSASIPVSYSSYSPSIGVEMNNANVSLNIAPGPEAPATQFQGSIKGYYSNQWIKNKTESTPAYGYLYTHRAEKDHFNNHLLDFNREMDHPYTQGMENINLSQLTYDVFNISGQGTGGMFRPHRSGVPIVGDVEKQNGNAANEIKVGLELGFGSAVRYGGDVQVGGATSKAGYWKKEYGNTMVDKVGAIWPQIPDAHFENVYMMNGGEMTPVDNKVYDAIGKDAAVAVDVEYRKNKWLTTDKLIDKNHKETKTLNQISTLTGRDYQRKPRTNYVQWKTNEEADRYGFVTMNESYSAFKDGNNYQLESYKIATPKIDPNPELVDSRKGHHIGEFVITKADGMQYVYGIPAYNHEQVEVGFAIGKESVDACGDDGLASYTDTEASKTNESGRDNFFEKTTTPAYAHSYLLTAVLSPDYVDVDGNGITHDDLGTAVKLNYERRINNYGWRAPYAANSNVARHNEGLMSLSDDDKASYTYGTKEVWYLHSIESKTHIAEFYTSARKDALGVTGEKGVKDQNLSNRLQKLDSILLFNKYDRMDQGISWGGDGATDVPDQPIKKVYFEYDYSLCDGVPNWADEAASEKGKLTLKKVRFAYGNSKKAMLSPYQFTYGLNPDYDLTHVDKWGSYQESDCDLPNHRFPYTRQQDADDNAEAWNLTKIELPSGGEINVNYEADDYAYVMNQHAAQMFQVAGVGNSTDFDPNLRDPNSQLYKSITVNKNYYVYFKLTKPVANKAELADLYIPEDRLLAHKFTIYVEGKGSPELISGYADIEDFGFATSDKAYGYLKLKPEKLKSGYKVNPISYNAFRFIHQNLSEKIHDVREDIKPNQLGKTIKSLAGHANVLANFLGGKYLSLLKKGFAKYCQPDKSVIRLKAPTGAKKGGGCRVSKIEMKDAWGSMASLGETGSYGMVYDYTMEITNGPSKILDYISSGVASYEPAMGSEENPLKKPMYYEVLKHPRFKFLGSERRYIEGPIGESFYPSPSVGYSQVTVKSLATENNNGNGTGYTVNRFFTSKDFPVQVDFTTIKSDRRMTRPPTPVVKWKAEKLFSSQGYVVRLNDMHGKPKAVWSHKQDGTPISGTQYQYKSDSLVTEDQNTYWLNNDVKMLKKSGDIETATIGLTHDIVLDARHTENKTWTGKAAYNLDVFAAGPIIIPLPTFYASYNRNKITYKSISTTKVIQQYGILESVTAYDEQSSVTTKNLLWDEETGDVLLTKTTNEYNDPLFNMKYPAHMAYDGMGPAYKNSDLKLKKVKIQNGIYTMASGVDASNYFSKGDMLSLKGITWELSGDVKQYLNTDTWVKGIKDNKVFVINRDGDAIERFVGEIKIVKSGRTNQLGEAVAAYTTAKNPLSNGATGLSNPFNVLQTSASEFSDDWPVYADEIRIRKCKPDTFITGPMLRTLNHLVDNNWFKTVGEVATSGDDTITYRYDHKWMFSGTKFNRVANKSTWYYDCSSATCGGTQYVDSKYVYHVVTQRGLSFEMVRQARLSNTSLKQYRSAVLKSVTPILRVSTNCCGTDTLFANRIRYREDITDSINTHHFFFGLRPNASGALGDDGCEFKLYREDWRIALDSITEFGNFRLDPKNDKPESFLIDAKIGGQWVELQGDAGDCYPIRTCWYECSMVEGDTINPYIHAARGKWRKKTDYVFHTDRTASYASTNPHNNTEIRNDGEFSYSPYWQFNNDQLEKYPTPSYKWISPAEIVHFSPHGNELEIKDALGRYSCEIYGYDRKLVSAVANNANHRNIGFDGFEDYDFPFHEDCRKAPHWAMQQDLATLVNNPYLNLDPVDNTYLELPLGIKFEENNTYKIKVPWLDYDNGSNESQSIIGKKTTDNFSIGLYKDDFTFRLGTTSYTQATGLNLGTTTDFVFQVELSNIDETAKTLDVKLSILDINTQSELASYSVTSANSAGFINTGDLKTLMGCYQAGVKRKPTGRFYEYQIFKNGTLINKWALASRGLKKYDSYGNNDASVISDNIVSATTPLDDQLNPDIFGSFTVGPQPVMQYVPTSNLKPFLSYDTAHTGRASLFIPEGVRHVTTDAIYTDPDTSSYNHHELRVFRVDADMNVGKFAPEAGKKFVISAWVKRADETVTEYPVAYDSLYMKVVFENSTASPVKVFPDGPIIEGWQRIFGTFTIPDGVDKPTNLKTMAVVGDVPGSAYGGYFDDIRIQPFNSNMKSYVYDPLTLRLTAELDENNFATLYEYDAEGRLTRIKKETEKGIVTLQESRYGIVK